MNEQLTYVLVAVLVIIIIIMFLVMGCHGKAMTNVKPEEDFRNASPRPIGDIVLYYSTSCGYCTQFMPTWEQFEKYAIHNIPGLTLRKMKCDGQQAQVCFEKYGIQGFPTVILYTRNGDKVMFDKNRTLEDLINFVNENRTK